MADYKFNTKPQDSTGREHKAVDPTQYTDMALYLEAIMAEARKTDHDYIMGDYVLNIMAAREYMDVKPNNLDALRAMHIQDDEEKTPEAIGRGIQKAHMELAENEFMQAYLHSRSVDYLKNLVSSGGHGGKLERDVKKFALAYTGPLPREIPARYTPSALTRIEALQKQLKGLKRDDPEFKKRAASICMEIAATRAAVDCKRGDKSTLKRQYSIETMNKYYEGLMKTAGKSVSDADLNRLVRCALKTPGHGGTMESVVEDLVRKDMQRSHSIPNMDVPGRYQVTYGDRLEALRTNMRDALAGRTPEDKKKLKSALAEMIELKKHFKAYRAEVGNNTHLIYGKRFGGSFDDGFVESVEKNANGESFERYADALMNNKDAREKLETLLSSDGDFEKNVELIQKEMTKENLRIEQEKLTPQERERRLKDKAEELKKNFEAEDKQVEGKKGTDLRKQMNGDVLSSAMKFAQGWDENSDPIDAAEGLDRMRELFDKQMAMTNAYNKSIDPNTNLVDEQEYARQLNGSRFQLNLEEVRMDPTYQKMREDIIKEESERIGENGLLAELAKYATNPQRLQDRYQAELEEQKAAEKDVPERSKDMDKVRELL